MAVSETFVHIPWWTWVNLAVMVVIIVGIVWFVRRYLPRLIAYIRREWDKSAPPSPQQQHTPDQN